MSLLPQKSKYDEYVKMGLLKSVSHISPTSGKQLTCYQYTQITQFDRLWNTVTLSARGIVFDEDGRIIQRCFPKFFNADEPEGIILTKTLTPIRTVAYEKLDGSLIKVSSDPKHGLIVTSKASFISDQANWAKEILEQQNYTFNKGFTYHFELIHPMNQIVLNYGGRKELILLAVVENETGKEHELKHFGEFKTVETLPNDVLNDVNSLNNDGLHEGIVVDYGTYRLKMKTDEYVRLHRIVTDYTPKRVWEALSEGQAIDRLNVPEEFLKWLETTEQELITEYGKIMIRINQAIEETKDMTNKEIGLSDMGWVKPFIFASRSGKDLSPMIWKMVKPKGGEDASS